MHLMKKMGEYVCVHATLVDALNGQEFIKYQCVCLPTPLESRFNPNSVTFWRMSKFRFRRLVLS